MPAKPESPSERSARKDFSPLLPPLTRKQPVWKRAFYLGGALLLFLIGILGWLIPVVTGIPFYVAGLILLGMGSQRVRDWINQLEAKLSPQWRGRLRDGIQRIPIKRIRTLGQ